MADIVIRELPLAYYQFEVDGIVVLENRRNDLTIDSKRIPGTAYAHFKTSEGASIFEKQNVLPTDVTVIDIDDNEYNPTDVEQLKGYLDDIDFFAWQSNYAGGGSGGVDRFDQLNDTFSYPGKQFMFPRVNASETGLEAIPLLVHDRITQHVDWGGANPLQAIDNGRRVVQAMVGGVPKLIMADDTANSPTAPNQIVFADIQKTGDDEITLFANGLWKISGIDYSNALDIARDIPFADSGKRRLDAGYLDQNGDFLIQTGVEVDISETALLPSIPANTLLATIISVTDNDISSEPIPQANPWITKFSMLRENIYSSGTFELPLSNRTRYDIFSDCQLTGISNLSDAPDTDPNYDGQLFWIHNVNASEVVIEHEGSGGLRFWFYDQTNHTIPFYATWEFKFNKVQNRLEFVGILGGGSTEFGTFENAYTWENTGDPLTFELEEGQKVANVFINGAPIFKRNGYWEQAGEDLILNDTLIGPYLIDGEEAEITATGIGPGSTPPPEGRTVDDTIDLTVI